MNFPKNNFIKGFTIIETIVAIFVFILALGAVVVFVILEYKTQDYSMRQSIAIDEARKGIEIMTKEIREAKTGQDGSYVIGKAEDYEFCFYSDIDKDLAIEKVRYFVDQTDFKKAVIEPEGIPAVYSEEDEEIFVLSQYVRNSSPIFRYYDSNGNELDSPARKKDAKLMKLYLVINVNPFRTPDDFELETEIQIRNLKTNL